MTQLFKQVSKIKELFLAVFWTEEALSIHATFYGPTSVGMQLGWSLGVLNASSSLMSQN